MTRPPRRKYDDFARIIPWASMGRSSIAAQVAQCLLPIGTYDSSLPTWEYEGTSKRVSNQDEDFEKHLLNIVGTGIRTGTGKLVTCLHVVDEVFQGKLRVYALVTRSVSTNTRMYTACLIETACKYIRPGQRKADANVDLAVVPFVSRDSSGNILGTPPIVWGDSTNLGVGDRVLIGGYPYGTAMFKVAQTNRGIIQPTFIDGIVSAIIPAQNSRETRLLQLSTLAAGGMSGGAVFNPETGEAYGMVTSSLQDPCGTLLPATYAIPSEVILPFSGSINFKAGQMGQFGVNDPMWFDEIDSS